MRSWLPLAGLLGFALASGAAAILMYGIIAEAMRGAAGAPLRALALWLTGSVAALVAAAWLWWRSERGAAAQRQLLGESLRASEAAMYLNSRAVEASANGIMIVDCATAENPIIYVNPAIERITGYAASELLGRSAHLLQAGDPDQFGLTEVRAALRERREGTALLRNYRKDGSLFWCELAISPVRDKSGTVTHFVGVMNDITQRRLYEEQLERQANHDELTGLANRNLARDRIAKSIAYAARSRSLVALLFIDVDRFKRINDSLGHAEGDAVLREMARRLVSCVRDRDSVARLGSDEFVVVLTEIAQREDVAKVAEKILNAIQEPVALGGHEISLSVSVGISFYPENGDNFEALLKHADTAMYHSKDVGRGGFHFYNAEMDTRALEKLTLETELRHAVQRDELQLYYQPIVGVQSGQVTDVEALVQWNSKTRGVIAPGEFIPLAEEHGLIVPIGEWVLRNACREIKGVLDAGLPELVVAVNLSARQFRDATLPDMVRAGLRESGLPARLLKLEITESTVMQNPERTAAILAELKLLGVGVAVDDFGTGYSSLAYLTRFPIDQMKIDRSFVRAVAGGPDSVAVLAGIVGLARNLKMQTVVEGIETRAQLELVTAAGCDKVQGYLLSRPLPLADLAPLVRRFQEERVV